LQLWEEQKDEFDSQLANDQQLLLEQFGLERGNQVRDKILTTLFAWSDTGEYLKITPSLLDIWREDVGDDSKLVQNERRFKEWLQLLDIVYLSSQSQDKNELLIEGLAAKVIRACLLAEE